MRSIVYCASVPGAGMGLPAAVCRLKSSSAFPVLIKKLSRIADNIT